MKKSKKQRKKVRKVQKFCILHSQFFLVLHFTFYASALTCLSSPLKVVKAILSTTNPPGQEKSPCLSEWSVCYYVLTVFTVTCNTNIVYSEIGSMSSKLAAIKKVNTFPFVPLIWIMESLSRSSIYKTK